MRSIEHIKRYTTTGMATDQGKTSNMNALAIAADALGREIAEVGLTTFRLPYTPVTFGIFGGPSKREMLDPDPRDADPFLVRRPRARSGRKRAYGSAPRAFRCPGESREETVKRECLTTRAKAGIMDASTLGKIEVVGPDAAEFLNRLYINSFTKLGVGRCRYGLMLNEKGFIYDDGVVMRLAQDRFHITTTTSGAAHVFAVMEDYLQTEWPDLKVPVHLDHRAMGDDRHQRAAGARNSRAAGRGHRPVERRLPAHERARGPLRRRADAARARQLHRRDGFRGQRARPTTASASRRRSGRKPRSAAPASTGSTRCCCCAPRKVSSSSARRPTAR